jgi:3-oxoadipate enol-lactonase
MATFDIAGDGQPIVFLHAALGDRRMWHPQWTAFSGTNRLLRVDMSGFGDNPPASTPFNRADDIITILDELGIEQAVVVGGSMGGRVAAELATRHPGRVTGLMLICAARTGHDWSPQVQKIWALEEEALGAGDLDAAVAVNLEFWLDGPTRDRASLSDDDRDLVAAMQRRAIKLERDHPEAVAETRRPDLNALVAQIQVPTRVLYGADDVEDIAAIARWYAAQIPTASLHEIADSAHLPSLEQPETCNALLSELLVDVG